MIFQKLSNNSKFLLPLVFVIGFEQNFTTVSESVEFVELCIRIMNVEDNEDLGVTVPLAVSTLPGSAG